MFNTGIIRQQIRYMIEAQLSAREIVRGHLKMVIEEGLAENCGNQCKTARALGMHRNTLARSISELGIVLPKRTRYFEPLRMKNLNRVPPSSDKLASNVLRPAKSTVS